MQMTGQSESGAGGNLTGMLTASEQAEEMIQGAMGAEPSMGGGAAMADTERAEYISEGFPIGSLPIPPPDAGGDTDAGVASMALFLDKLSERLAFERTGTRLYDGLINKCQTLAPDASDPSLDDLQEIRDEEHQHFMMLTEAITQVGGDPTVQSPCADVVGVASMGLMQVIMDPRTSVSQSLQAILTAELTDNAGWEMLAELAGELGYSDLNEQFEEALEAEERHLMNVQTWLKDMVMAKAA